jgi:anaerobic ribonucleoside-triphosphate reductase activating protein
VTISGGEPFDQPEALLALIKDLSSMRNKTRKHMDVLIYTGYSENRVRRKFSQHLLYIDALVVGPFVEGVAESKPYRGSDNQRIILYTALGEKRYGPENLANWKSGMQVAADDEGIWMIGIPRQGDLQKFEVGCSNQGLSLGKSSWRC